MGGGSPGRYGWFRRKWKERAKDKDESKDGKKEGKSGGGAKNGGECCFDVKGDGWAVVRRTRGDERKE